MMPRVSILHHRRSNRLRGYDYSQPGAYFVTICVQRRACLLGKVFESDVNLNDLGRIAADCWKHVPQHFQDVSIDTFVVMPNHVHAIIILSGRRGGVTVRPEEIGNTMTSGHR
jgi:REP element-mobilizing transposase RayT